MKTQVTKTIMLTLLFTVMLTATVSPVIASADSVPEKIGFNALISGDFYLGYKEYGLPLEGEGVGSTGIRGSASEIDEWTPPWSNEKVWRSESINAWGSISVSWTDMDDGEIHHLFATFYPVRSTVGISSQTDEWFFVAVPMFYDTVLRFKGIHVSSLGIQKISGGALFALGPSAMWGQDSLGDLCIVALYDEVGKSGKTNSEYWFYWSSEVIPEFQMYGLPPEPVYLPASPIFQWNMVTVY